MDEACSALHLVMTERVPDEQPAEAADAREVGGRSAAGLARRSLPGALGCLVERPTMIEVYCGACGAALVRRVVAPCLDCGGDPAELEQLREGSHTYARLQLFDGDVLCDFCEADLPGGDPRAWGFPRGFKWSASITEASRDPFSPTSEGREELACPSCHNTLRKQAFVQVNALRHGVDIPTEYWPHLKRSHR